MLRISMAQNATGYKVAEEIKRLEFLPRRDCDEHIGYEDRRIPQMASVQQRQATSTVATANSNSGKQESTSTFISKAASTGVWKV
jgi:hypothetical protein